MSLQFINYKLSISGIKTSLLTGLIALYGSSVSATPLFNNDNLITDNLRSLAQTVSQNSQPPEVIIDTDPNNRDNSGSGSRSTNRTETTTTNSDTRFTCDYVNGEYTVMYNPETQGNNAYPWAIPTALGGGWSAERRCDEITNRLESYRADGLLEMSTGIENGYDTVCVTTQIDPTDCRIVLTVPPGQDPQITRDLVFENLLVADDGQQTQGVYTYKDGESGEDILGEIGNVIGGNKPASSPDKINLRPFLDPADGGTGTKLRNNRSNRVTPNRSSGSSDERKPAIFQ